ncbi:MAG TPA: ParB/RepB/Spo0J family partition protein [Mycobacteriales bacterium]|nr:ParB/RepB/Spo0J family partition protein [Mycobacteriales bacterium]
MTQRKGGLGRGLGALIPSGPPPSPGPDEPATVADHAAAEHVSAASTPSPPFPGDSATSGPGAYFREIPIEAILPNPRQPRQHFDPDALAELVVSITEVGLLQPIVVRPLGDERFELVMGERRLRASRQAGLRAIPAIVRETAEADRLRDALLENLHRQALNPLEEAAAYAQLLEDFGATHEELAARIGRSRSQVSNTIRLLNLPPAVQRRVAAGVLSAGHARALLGLEDAASQESLATRIVAEGMSVRAVEETVHLAGTRAPGGAGPRSARRPIAQAPAAEALAGRLADYFETRVSVAMGRRRGKVVIEFASVDDLERIVALIAPELAASDEGDQSPD